MSDGVKAMEIERDESQTAPRNRNEFSSRFMTGFKIMIFILAVMHAVLFAIGISNKLSPTANGLMAVMFGFLILLYLLTGWTSLKWWRGESTDSSTLYVKVLLVISGVSMVVSLVLFLMITDTSPTVMTVSMVMAMVAWVILLFILISYKGPAPKKEPQRPLLVPVGEWTVSNMLKRLVGK
jgi:hypothetical protein